MLSNVEQLQLHYYPLENHYVSINVGHYYSEQIKNDQHSVYADVRYRYTFTRKKIDLEWSLSNLFNEDAYTTAYFNDYYYYQSTYKLRPRQLMFSVKFSF